MIWNMQFYSVFTSSYSKNTYSKHINNMFQFNNISFFLTKILSVYILQTVQNMAKQRQCVYRTERSSVCLCHHFFKSWYPGKCNDQWDREVGLGISPNCVSVITETSGSIWKRGRDSNQQIINYFTLWRPINIWNHKLMNSQLDTTYWESKKLIWVCYLFDWIPDVPIVCHLRVALYPFHAVQFGVSFSLVRLDDAQLQTKWNQGHR